MERYSPTKVDLLFANEKAKEHIKNRGGLADTFSTYLTAFVAGIEYVKGVPSKVEHSFNRDENSLEGRAAIEFYEWMQRTNMAKTDIPINIKWRMFVDQLNFDKRHTQ